MNELKPSAGGRAARDRPRRRRRREGPSGSAAAAPPSLYGGTLVRIPLPYREEAMQEAWVAHLGAEDPNIAVWSYLKRIRRRERRCTCFSQLDPREQLRIYEELPA